MERAVIFVTGQDPTTGKGGGSGYVRTHSRAALMAGFETHIFCVSKNDDTVETDFGTVHRVATPWRLRGPLLVDPEESPERFFAHWIGAAIHTPHMAPLHAGALTRRIERFMLADPKSYLVHSFCCWGVVGLKVRERMKSHGMSIPVVTSFYTTMADEVYGKLAGARHVGSARYRFLLHCELLWTVLMGRRWEGRVFTQSQLLAVNYKSVRQAMLEQHGRQLEIRDLPYCPESVFLHPIGKAAQVHPDSASSKEAAEAPLIITVSRHDPRKGLETLIRSLASLRNKGVAFRARLASGGPLLHYHRQLVEELNLTDQVLLLGWIDDPYNLMEQADIFVLPSLQEGSGSLSLLEAMQSGLALVASNVDGIPEDVTDGVEGLLVEPANVEALSEALEKLLTNSGLLHQFQLRAAEQFRQNYSAEQFCSTLGAVYEELWE